MPRTNIRPRHNRRTKLTEAHVNQLLTGHDYLNIAFGRQTTNTEPDWDAMRKAWDNLRDELLPAFIAQNPGRRPFAFWKFDAPEPRRGTVPRVARDRKGIIAECQEESRLFLAGIRPEPERDYLARLGLLLPGE